MQRIRSQQIPYGTPTSLVVPRSPTFLGIATAFDPHGGSPKARLAWIEDSQFPQREEIHVILFRGDADLEYDGYHKIKPLFITHDQHRRHNAIATLCTAVPTAAPIPEFDPNPQPKHPPTPPSPESLAAVAAHERKMRLKAEAEAALKAAEESTDEPKDAVATQTIPDEPPAADELEMLSKPESKPSPPKRKPGRPRKATV